MEELVRWILTSAPNLVVGLVCLAALRLLVDLIFEALQHPCIDALKAWAEKARDRENPHEPAYHLLPGAILPLLGLVLTTAAALGLGLWMFVTAWAVIAALPGLLGAHVWWLGPLLAVIEFLLPYSEWRRTQHHEQFGKAVLMLAVPLCVAASIVYSLAPAGLLFYVAIFVLGRAARRRMRIFDRN